MQYTTLGRTGLRVSVAGLGCGGSSRLGLGYGHSEAQAGEVLRAALDQGVNLIDTAAAYGTEQAVGLALAGTARDQVVISTKAMITANGQRRAVADITASLEDSLRALRTDHVDVFHLHAVNPRDYAFARDEIAPALLRAKEQGKLRHLGITETAPNDHEHLTLAQASRELPWEVVMVAFHMMCQNARNAVLPQCRANGVGTLLMFAVRAIFSVPGYLQEITGQLADAGKLPAGVDPNDPLAFLIRPDGAASLTEAAYRYARHEPGIDVVLFGTGKPAHVASNVAAILRPPLPPADQARLRELFGGLVGVGLDLPRRPS